MKKDHKLISAYIPIEMYELFQSVSKKNHITLTTVIERSLFLYMSDDDYRRKINSIINTKLNDERKLPS